MTDDMRSDDARLRDRDLSVDALRSTCEALRRELEREQEDLAAVDEEFRQSLSYRIGSMLCLHSRS